MYKYRVAVIVLLIAVGLSMVAIAAIASRTTSNNPGLTTGSGGVGGMAQASGYRASYFVNQDIEGEILQLITNRSHEDVLRIISLLARNISIQPLSLNISRATINGSLSFIEDSVAYIQRGQGSIRVVLPGRLYDGEKILSIQNALFLKILNKDDSLSIRAINITIMNARGEKIASVYIAIEIRDLTTGKVLVAAASPLNLD